MYLCHRICAEQVDRQVLLKRGNIAEVIEERQAGVINEEIERLDALDGCLDLLCVRHVQGQGRDALIGWIKGWRVPAYTRFAPLVNASSTSAWPMPRLAPVTKTVLSAIVITPSW